MNRQADSRRKGSVALELFLVAIRKGRMNREDDLGDKFDLAPCELAGPTSSDGSALTRYRNCFAFLLHRTSVCDSMEPDQSH